VRRPTGVFRGQLGVGVGLAPGSQRERLIDDPPFHKAEDIIGADVDQPPDTCVRGGIEHILRTGHVDVFEQLSRRPVGHHAGAVEDNVDAVAGSLNAGERPNITLDDTYTVAELPQLIGAGILGKREHSDLAGESGKPPD